MNEKNERPSFDTLIMWMAIITVALMVLSLIVGCTEKPKPVQTSYSIDSLRKVHKQLIDCDNGLETLEDSIHEYEDGF